MSCAARFEWSAGVIRLYDSEATADSKGQFVGIVSINRTGPNHAFLFGLHASMTRDMRAALVRCLIDNGITQSTDVRHGRWVTRDLRLEACRHAHEPPHA